MPDQSHESQKKALAEAITKYGVVVRGYVTERECSSELKKML